MDDLKAEAILYINQMLSDQYSLVEERRLDPNYVHDQDLKEMTEHELAEILNAQKFMAYIIEEEEEDPLSEFDAASYT